MEVVEGENGYQVLETKSVNPFAEVTVSANADTDLNTGLTEQLILQTQMKFQQQATALTLSLPLTLTTIAAAEAAVAAVETAEAQAEAAATPPEAPE